MLQVKLHFVFLSKDSALYLFLLFLKAKIGHFQAQYVFFNNISIS